MYYNKLKSCLFITLFVLTITKVFSQMPFANLYAPSFSHLSGRYNSDIQVQLTTSTTNAVMFYTLDGSTPDSTSQQYIGSIPIVGDGSYVTLKAITISNDTLKSMVSSAIYLIDYSFNPNSGYLTNLTWADYNNFIQGDWFGYASTPWTSNYCVKLSILPNGNYIDTASSGSGGQPYDYFYPVFYYGTRDASPFKVITPYNILASGYANGYIDIDFGSGSTNQDELRYIKFIDDKNLYLEMWHHFIYGPLKYYLTKKNANIPTGNKEYKHENTLIHPNPASDLLFIKNLNSDVQFINQLGESFLFEKNKTLSVSHLPRGLYIVLFKNSDGVQVKQKIVLE